MSSFFLPLFKCSFIGYGKAVVLAVTAEGISRTQMQGGCPVAVGMGQGATLSRVQCHRVGPLDIPLPTHTSHTVSVRNTVSSNHSYYVK